MRSAWASVCALATAVFVAACGAGAAPTRTQAPTSSLAPTSVATASSSGPGTSVAGPLEVPTGIDLCNLLAAPDFSAAGVGGAGQVKENNLDTAFYCTYAGDSVATGGIELDAFVVDSDTDRDEIFASVSAGEDAEDVTGLVAGAQRATLGTTTSSGPEFAEIAVQSGNLIFGLGIPAAGDWHTQLVTLANLVMTRAAALSG